MKNNFIYLFLFLLSSLFAREIYVHPFVGDDSADGSKAFPLKSFNLAISQAEAGDHIHILPVDGIIRGNLTVKNKHGEPEKPIIIDAHFNTFSGVVPFQEEQWQKMEPGLFKSLEKIIPSVKIRYFMCFNGKIERMGRSSKWHRTPFKAYQELKDYNWTIDEEDFVWFRIPADKSPEDCQVEEIALRASSGVVLVGENSHLQFRNIIVQNFWNDGYNLHGSSNDIFFENIAALYNGDDGISAHGTCEFNLKNFLSVGNSNGICHINDAIAVHENVYIADSAGRDLYMLNSKNIFRNVLVKGNSAGGVEFGSDKKETDEKSENILENCFFHGLLASNRLVQTKKTKLSGKNVKSFAWQFSGKNTPEFWEYLEDFAQFDAVSSALKKEISAVFSTKLANLLTFNSADAFNLLPQLSENSFYDKLSSEPITPHIKWAKPFHAKELRALVIAPICQRETIELAQRLSINCTALMTNSYQDTYLDRPMLKNEIAAMDPLFRHKLNQNYDLIIIGKMSWSALPEFVRSAIIKKLQQGTGLMYVEPKDYSELQEMLEKDNASEPESLISSTVPINELPQLNKLSAAKLLNLYKLENGRVAIIDYGQKVSAKSWHSLTPEYEYVQGNLQYEYYHSLLAKVALWSAGRNEKIQVKSSKLNENQNKLKLELSLIAEKQENIEIKYVIRNYQNNIFIEEKQSFLLEKGLNIIAKDFSFPEAGLHFFDFWIYSEDKIANWGSLAKNIERENTFTKIVLEKEEFASNEKISGSVVFSSVPAANSLFRITLRDNFQRIIDQQDFVCAGQKYFDFSLNNYQSLSLLMHLEAELIDVDGQKICSSRREITVPKNQYDDFYFLMWAWSINDADSYIAELLLKQFYQYGVDTLYDAPSAQSHQNLLAQRISDRSKICARANLNFVPYMLSLTAGAIERNDKSEKLIRPRCFTDPNYRKEIMGSIRKTVPIVKKYGSSVYSLSINGELAQRKDYCFSETCQESFRVFLQKNYKDLEHLNEVWSTAYENWSEVRASTFEEAKEQNNYSSWVAHRQHMEEVFATFLGDCREEIRQLDSRALVGMDELRETSSFAGFDWWHLLNSLDYCSAYTHNFQRYEHKELIRSFLTADKSFSGLWMGSYNRSEEYNRYIPWQTIFNGMNTVSWWMGYNNAGGYTWSALEPSFKELPFFAQAAEEISEIKKGIGRLLLNSEKIKDKIAIYYSALSVHASTIVDGPDSGERSLFQAQMNFIYALKDLGLQFDFVAAEQIKQGKLLPEDYKVLIMPCVRAIAQEEVDEIKKFVKNGNLLLVDQIPGTMDQYCRENNENPFAEMFDDFQKKLTINTFGAGKTIWFDDFLKTYLSQRKQGKTAEIKNKFSEILQSVSLEPSIKISSLDGSELSGIEFSRFRNSDIEFLCLLPDYENIPSYDTRSFKIVLQQVWHIYDVREAKYLGETKEFECTVKPAKAQVFALLPFRINDLKLNVKKETYKPGEFFEMAIEADCNSEYAAKHLFRIDFYDPQNNYIPHLSENYLSENQQAEYKKFLAKNKQKGIWQVKVKDIASGKKQNIKFKVE